MMADPRYAVWESEPLNSTDLTCVKPTTYMYALVVNGIL